MGTPFYEWILPKRTRTGVQQSNAEQLHERGISLRILTGTLAGMYSPRGEGKFFFTMMVAFAELERDMIVERTRAGLEAAKAQGRTLGRPTVLSDDQMPIARARRAEGCGRAPS